MEQMSKASSGLSGTATSDLQDSAMLSSLFSQCLDGTVSEEAELLLGGILERPWGLIAIAARSPRQHGVDKIMLKRSPVEHVSAMHGDQAVIMVPYAQIDHFVEEAVGKEAENYRIVVSFPFNDISGIPQLYGLVAHCLATGTHSYEVISQGKALEYLKHSILDSVKVCGLLHPALEKLRAYDRSNQSDMLKTLKVYLENDRNAQRCANLLYLHRNSLQYRVRRIQEIADINLDDPNERAFLRLSLFLDD